MKIKFLFFLGLLITLSFSPALAQLESYRLDDTTGMFRDLCHIRNKYSNLSFTGYLQAQFQYADSTGIPSYNGGDFSKYTNNRFMLRRARLRADYENLNESGFKKFYFALQFDGTEKCVNIRDMFGRIYENKLNYFVATVGMFNRPFGFEVNYSSASRETPERGRMSQIIMNGERDLGSMISFEPQDKNSKWYKLKVDAGFFNGQGLTGKADFDKYKDFVSRISLRKTEIYNNLFLTGGVSYLNGGFRNGSRYNHTTMKNDSGYFIMFADTSVSNIEKKAPRVYYGADIQLAYESGLGKTEIRAEYIFGTQSATLHSSVTPGTPPLMSNSHPDSIYSRNFDGAYFYLLHTFKKKHQIVFKYDWYDPNVKIAGSSLLASNGFGNGDIRYDTFGCGYIFYYNNHLKVVLYYDHPMNEISGMSGFSKDLQ